MSKKVELTIDGMMCGMCEASFILDQDMPLQMVRHDLKEEFDPMGYKLLDVEEVDAPQKKGLFGFGKKK